MLRFTRSVKLFATVQLVTAEDSVVIFPHLFLPFPPSSFLPCNARCLQINGPHFHHRYNTVSKQRAVGFVSSATQIIYSIELQPVVCSGWWLVGLPTSDAGPDPRGVQGSTPRVVGPSNVNIWVRMERWLLLKGAGLTTTAPTTRANSWRATRTPKTSSCVYVKLGKCLMWWYLLFREINLMVNDKNEFVTKRLRWPNLQFTVFMNRCWNVGEYYCFQPSHKFIWGYYCTEIMKLSGYLTWEVFEINCSDFQVLY